jgi:hypothetical protein
MDGGSGACRTAVDLGGGSSPLQFFLSEACESVANIDINFMSSWFPVDGDGIYTRADKRRLMSQSRPENIERIEGDILSGLKR